MPGLGNEQTVEERLEKARLLPRISPDALNMCKSVDQLLHAQHVSNLAQAVTCVQEIARDNFAVVVALKWVVLLVDMLESDTPDVRLASCNALAAVCVAQEGRDAVRSAGGLRPLVLLLVEGSRSPTAAAAAAAVMNCSACDICKEAIADCRGVPLLLALIKEAVLRCSVSNPAPGAGPANTPKTSSSGTAPAPAITGGGSAASSAQKGQGQASSSTNQDLRTPAECKAAVFAAGALMNMGGVMSVQDKLMAAGAVSILEATVRVALPGDVVATRANFMLSWLAVATGGLHPEREQRQSAAGLLASGGSHGHGHAFVPSPTATPRSGTAQSSRAGSAPNSARSTASGSGAVSRASGPGSAVPAAATPPAHPSRLGSPAGVTAAGRTMAGSPVVALRASAAGGTPDHSKPGSAVGGSKAAALTGHA